MKYLIYKDCYEEYDNIYISTEENAEKGDLVVYDGSESPGLVKIVSIMDELTAITSDRYFIKAIKVVSMKAWLERKAVEIKKAKLVKLMKEQMEIQKLEDTLKKNSECNEEMAKPFAQYKELTL